MSDATRAPDPDWTTLVDADTLALTLGADDLVVVDARAVLTDPTAGDTAYREGHVPGAVHAHLDRDLSGPAAAGAGRHPWPDAVRFTATLGRWGITPAHRVVAYDAGDGAYAARVWFLLRALGHRQVAVLDGGYARWCAAGLRSRPACPTSLRARIAARSTTACCSTRTMCRRTSRTVASWSMRARPSVSAATSNRSIRRRPRARRGQSALRRQSRRRPFQVGRQVGRGIRGLARRQRARECVVMCGSGVTACHHLLAMTHAGSPGARLFTGSWSGWINDRSRPVATGDA